MRSRFSTERCNRSTGTTGQRNLARSSSLMLVQSQWVTRHSPSVSGSICQP